MSVQTTYGYSNPTGAPGGIVDLAPYAIDTFLNEEDTGVMKFGLGVVEGTKPGVNFALPTAASTAAEFIGIVSNNRHTELDLDGRIRILKAAPAGIMRYGRIYGRVATGVSTAYGDNVYLITSGDEAGFFTNDEDDGIAIKGRFLGTVDSITGVAAIELFNQMQEVPASNG